MATVTAKSGYHHGDLRQQLIAATRALVEEKGPDGFSVSEACRAAGVSTAAPYKHFADRTEMLREVSLQGFREMTADFVEVLKDKTDGSIEAIAALGAAYVHFAEANPGVFRMMFAATHKTDEMEEAGYGCYGMVQAQVARHMGRETVDADVERATFPLWTFVHGLAFLRIDGKAEDEKMGTTVDAIVHEATRRLLNGEI